MVSSSNSTNTNKCEYITSNLIFLKCDLSLLYNITVVGVIKIIIIIISSIKIIRGRKKELTFKSVSFIL